MVSPDEIAVCRAWMLARLDIACRSGFFDLSRLLDGLADELVNQLDRDLEDASVAALFAELTARAELAFAARAAEEASWTERTITDRIDDALADLAHQGLKVSRAACASIGDGLVERLTDEGDPWELLPDARWDLALVLHFEAAQVRAVGELDARNSTSRRDAELAKEGAEIIRILAHHGISAAWNAESRRVELAHFRFQKRTTTKAPGTALRAPPAPPAPPVCTLCGGKGWVATDPRRFPELCVCKGGKRV